MLPCRSSNELIKAQAVIVYSVIYSPGLPLRLNIAHLFVSLPANAQPQDMQWIDLPFHGRVSVPPAAQKTLSGMKYMGMVEPADTYDQQVVRLIKTRDGFIARGLVSLPLPLHLALWFVVQRHHNHHTRLALLPL